MAFPDDALTDLSAAEPFQAPLNLLRDGGGWRNFACAVSGMTNASATTARYMRIGAKVRVQIVITFTGASVASGNGLQLTLPVNAAILAPREQLGTCTITDASASTRFAGVVVAHGTTLNVAIVQSLGTNGQHTATTATSPITWANTDTVVIDFEYIAA